jgi:DeoR/GlpR family transcriptional regulator of sugar metabolism
MANTQKCATTRKKETVVKLTQRQGEILRILKEKGYAKVEELSALTYISPSSVRRDLQYLESMGIVEREYGGAKLFGGERKTAPIRIRKDKNKSLKREVCKKGSTLCKDGYTVLIDSSTTCYYLAEALTAYNGITVFTNNIDTAAKCIEMGINTYVIGGHSVRGMPVLAGSYAEEMLEKINADISFVSSYGVDENGVVTDPSEEETRMRKIMLSRGRIKVLLLDRTKIGRSSVHKLCTLDDVDYMFSND